MKYNTYAHLPSQIETFLNAYNQGNPEILERTYSNIKDVIQDKTFHKDIDEYKNKLEQEIKQLEKNTLETIQNASKTKTIDDIIQTLNQAENKLQSLNNSYLETIKSYIVGWTSQLDLTEDE